MPRSVEKQDELDLRDPLPRGSLRRSIALSYVIALSTLWAAVMIILLIVITACSWDAGLNTSGSIVKQQEVKSDIEKSEIPPVVGSDR